MVAVPSQSPKLTPTEYFAWEEQQLHRQEYINTVATASPPLLPSKIIRKNSTPGCTRFAQLMISPFSVIHRNG